MNLRKSKDQVRAEYRFDYEKAKPNRFSPSMEKGVVVVILDPDVAEAFYSSAN